MNVRKSFVAALTAAAIAGGVTVTADAEAADISFGTLAPKASPWGKVFEAWRKYLKGKGIEVKFYYNGAQGDEGAMVAKIRSGQLDGAAVTAVGLGKIHKDVLVMQSPGLFSDWATVDKVRSAMMPTFAANFAKEGFKLLGNGDVGLAHTMSKGKAIRAPGDLKSMKVYRWVDDIIAPVTASVIGYTAVPKSVPGLLPGLQSGQVNVITVPALAATQLQWASELDHVNEDVAGVGIGGLVMSAKSFDAIPADKRTIFQSSGEKAGKKLTDRIRNEDAKAYKMLARKMTVVKLDAGEKAKWASVFKKVRKTLGQGTFPAALVTKVERLAGK